MEEAIKTTKEVAIELLDMMGTNVAVDVTEDKVNEAILVDIKSDEETGLLIGSRGETLKSFQTILGMIVSKRLDNWYRILVNIADWREKQEEKLAVLAKDTAERAKSTGDPQALYNLSPADRRLVHMALAEDNEIETVSTGEGEERYLIVQLKK